MEEKKPISHVIGGLLIALVLIVFAVAMSFISKGTASDPKGGWTSYIIIIAGLILLINLYGKAHNNHVSFGDLFSYGFKTTTMLTLVFVIFLVILSFVSPDLKQQALDATRTEMEKNKNFNDREIEQGIELIKKYFWVFAIAGTVLGFVIIGAIGSLLGAAITKKLPKDPFHQDNSLQPQ